ncbi:MAG: tetratricopeptide repeat protein [Vicinamibacteria bacterium]
MRAERGVGSWLALASVTAFLLLGHVAIVQATQADDPSQPYWAAVDQFARGNVITATSAVSQWSQTQLDSYLKAIEESAKASRKCSDCDGRFDALPLRMALLLHISQDSVERSKAIIKTHRPDCSVGAQIHAIERLIPLVAQQPNGKAFLGSVSAAMAIYMRSMFCPSYGWTWATVGLNYDSKNALLYFARGLAEETAGSVNLPVAPLVQIANQRSRSIMTAESDKKQWLADAASSYEKVLKIEPTFAEAQLRLGRVEWRLSHLPKARAALEKSVTVTKGSALYLSHCLLGKVLEDMEDLPGAAREYRAALDINPEGQVAAMALATTYSLLGQGDDAREVLKIVPGEPGRRKADDPFRAYLVGTPYLSARMLDDLRVEAAR